MKGVDTYQGRGLIADPIHQYFLYTRPGLIPGEATEQDLIDSAWMQRLRRIPQLQSARWVYPAAEHSRFQHALGVMHVAGRFATHLYPSLQVVFGGSGERDRLPSGPLIESLLRLTGLLHDIGHGPFGHFFDDNFLVDYGLTHETMGQKIIRDELGDTIRAMRRSPSGTFEDGERIDPEWICYIMGKAHSRPEEGQPRWLSFLKPLMSGIYTADNLDYVLRDSYMCGVAVGPVDLDRIIYYTFFTEEGLTLDRGGLQALKMFLTARYYMYTNVYFHRTTRAIDIHLKEIFHDTMRVLFPWNPAKQIREFLRLTEWTLLEEVGRWHEEPEPEKRHLGGEWKRIMDRDLKWRMAHEATVSQAELQRGRSFMRADEVERGITRNMPPPLKGVPFRVDMALQDPRPLNPLDMGERQIWVYDSATGTISKEPLAELFKYLPARVALYRVFAQSHEHDLELALAMERALGEDQPAIATNV